MTRLPARVVTATSILTVALTVVACEPSTDHPSIGQSPPGIESSFGSPAHASDADRVIEIETTDGLRFVPDDITVAAGETITFRLVNDGTVSHDFTLGDAATQAQHDFQMSEMAGMVHDEPNVATIAPGETVELTWTFGEEGIVLIGCHQPGHYAAGMTGRITVEG